MLNGWSQSESATRLGYQGSAQLSLWEQARRMPPLTALVQICRHYRVSMDFLVGLSDDPDRDPVAAERQQILAAASTSMESMARQLADAVIHQTNLGGPTLQATHLMKRDMARALEAFDKFVKLNPEFEDMRGGATLQATMADLSKSLSSALEIVQRHRRINDAAARGVIKQVRPHDNHPLFEQAANDD